MKKFILSLCVIFTVVLLVTGAAFAAEPDAQVKGLWLEIENFDWFHLSPEDAAREHAELEIDGDAVAYTRLLDGGDAKVIILRLANPDNAINGENIGVIVASVTGIDEANIEVSANPGADMAEFENEEDLIPQVIKYPHAFVSYTTEEDGVEFHNMDHFFFTEDEIFFWVRISMNEKGMEEYGEVTQGWFERMRIVERQ